MLKIQLKMFTYFTDAPFCKNPQDRDPIVVGRNSTVTLVCEVISQPSDNITFFWVKQAASSAESRMLGKGGIIGGDSRPDMPVPGLIDLVPTPSTEKSDVENYHYSLNNKTQRYSQDRHSLEKTYSDRIKYHHRSKQRAANVSKMHPEFPAVKVSDVLPGRTDINDAKKSFLTIVATQPLTVLCYAKNSEGRSRVPCQYTITVVGELFYLSILHHYRS